MICYDLLYLIVKLIISYCVTLYLMEDLEDSMGKLDQIDGTSGKSGNCGLLDVTECQELGGAGSSREAKEAEHTNSVRCCGKMWQVFPTYIPSSMK